MSNEGAVVPACGGAARLDSLKIRAAPANVLAVVNRLNINNTLAESPVISSFP